MSDLKPGRILDALIAEKVMGWKFIGPFTTDPTLGSDRWATDGNGCERYYSDVPDYSTSIAAAWEVVEKFKHIQLSVGHAGVWYAVISVYKDESTLFEEFEGASNKSAPHAICLAALNSLSQTP